MKKSRLLSWLQRCCHLPCHHCTMLLSCLASPELRCITIHSLLLSTIMGHLSVMTAGYSTMRFTRSLSVHHCLTMMCRLLKQQAPSPKPMAWQ